MTDEQRLKEFYLLKREHELNQLLTELERVNQDLRIRYKSSQRKIAKLRVELRKIQSEREKFYNGVLSESNG